MGVFSKQASWRKGEYAGNYIYKNGVLEFFNQPEGIVEPEADGYKYVYQYKDHLGNIRLSYKDADKNGSISQNEIVQEKNYYPFGLQHQGYNSDFNGRNHNYGYNGKEEQSELGLEWLDFGARNYDASLGRWMNMDPLGEEFYAVSLYNAMMNNPLSYIDPDGRFTVTVTGEEADKATQQINASSNLNVTRDKKTGKLSATGEAKTEADKKLLAAIKDTKINVNINATNEATLENGKPLLGGAFGGSVVNEDGTVDSFQTIDPDIQGGVDKASGRGNGVGALHEVLEGYVEGERALKSGEGSSDASTQAGNENYVPAHTTAGTIDPRYSNNPVSIGFSDQSRTKVPGVKETTRTYHVRKSDGSRSPVGKKTFINKRKKRN